MNMRACVSIKQMVTFLQNGSSYNFKIVLLSSMIPALLNLSDYDCPNDNCVYTNKLVRFL